MKALSPQRYSPPQQIVPPAIQAGEPTPKSNLVSSKDAIAWTQKPTISQEDAKRATAQRNSRELELIANNPVCPAVQGARKLNSEGLADLLKKDYYDPEAMTQAFCALDGLIIEAGSTGRQDKLRRLLRRMRRIGAESGYGVAMAANMGTPGDTVIVKTSKDVKDDGSLLHEFTTGIFATNPLRSFIFNFAFILGAFKCSPPILKEKEVVTYCEGTPSINYVIYENIAPAQPAADWVQSTTALGFIRMFYQVALALRLAHLQADFTHSDLHSNNVMIRDLSPLPSPGPMNQDRYVPYPKTGGEVLIRTNEVPVMIDFGTSHFRYDGRSYGFYEFTRYGVLPDTSFPMHDIYKFNLSCAQSAALANNSQVIGVCEKIYRFFNKDEDLKSVIDVEANSYFALPPLPHLVTIRHDEFLAYFESTFANEIAEFATVPANLPPGAVVLNCQTSNLCMTTEQIREKLGLIGESVTPSLLELYESQRRVDINTYLSADTKNLEEFKLAISEAANRSRDLPAPYVPNGPGPTNGGWKSVQLIPTSQNERAIFLSTYYNQVVNLVGLIDASWQIQRHAAAGIDMARRVLQSLPSTGLERQSIQNVGLDTETKSLIESRLNTYETEYRNFVNTFSPLLRSSLGNFINDMNWLGSGTRMQMLGDKRGLFNSAIDFVNAFTANVGQGRYPRIGLLLIPVG